MSRPCIFFDRDGIINKPVAYYILSPEEFHVYPEFLEALRLVTERGYVSVVATNQKCVGLGQLSQEGLDAIHDKLRSELAAVGLELLDIKWCGDTEPSPWKKPAPGMLLEAAEAHDLDVARSWMIGDSPRDVEAGKAAGCQTLLINAEKTSEFADHHLSSIDGLVAFLDQML